MCAYVRAEMRSVSPRAFAYSFPFAIELNATVSARIACAGRWARWRRARSRRKLNSAFAPRGKSHMCACLRAEMRA